MHRRFELSDPAVSLLVAIAVYLYVGGHLPAVDARIAGDRTTLYGPLAGVFGSLLGFVIAAFSVVVTLIQNDRVTLIRQRRLDARVWRAFVLSALWCAAATVVPVIGLVCDRTGSNNPLLLSALALVTLAGGLSIARCVWILALIGAAVRARPDAPAPPSPASSV
jgi:hypothetical protein